MFAMDEFANFAIWSQHSPARGAPPIFIPHHPDSYEYTYVSSAVYIALSMMRTRECLEAMTTVAFDFDHIALRGRRFRGSVDRARQRVRQFVDKVTERFPVMVIDPSLMQQGALACHYRTPWFGHLDEFDPRPQTVSLDAGVRITFNPSSSSSSPFDYSKLL